MIHSNLRRTTVCLSFLDIYLFKEVDLGLAPTDMIWHRAQVMEFTDVVVFSSVAMVYRQGPSEPLQGLLSVMSTPLLAGIGGALAAVTLIIVCFEVKCAWSDRDFDKRLMTECTDQRSGHRVQKQNDTGQRHCVWNLRDACRRNRTADRNQRGPVGTPQAAGPQSCGFTPVNVLLAVWAALLSERE